MSLKIVVVLTFMNSAAELMRASGISDAMGIDPDPGAASRLKEALDAAGQINPSSGFGETLFLMYVSVTQTFYAIFEFVFAAPSMFINVGIPTMLVGFLFAPLMFIVAIDTAYLLIGRSA